MTPEFREISPAAGRGRVKIAVGSEHAGGGQHVEVGMPEQKVAKGLYGDDETGPAFGVAGALAELDGDCRVAAWWSSPSKARSNLKVWRISRGRVSTRCPVCFEMIGEACRFR